MNTFHSLQTFTGKLPNYEVFLDYYYQAKKLVNQNLAGTAASHNRLLQFQKLLELINVNPLIHTMPLYDAYWNYFLETMKLYPGVTSSLEAMKKIASLCLITNLTAHIQYRKIQQLNIAHYFDYIVTSEEIGVEKPSSRIFTYALEKTQTLPQNTFMIGDDFEKDIQGALNVGIKPLFFSLEQTTSDNFNPAVQTFNSFNQVMDILCKTI